MLADIKVPRKEHRVGEHSFSVRGITFMDIATLVSSGERAELEQAIALVIEGKDEAQDNGVVSSRLIGSLLAQLPKLAAKVIAVSADEPEDWASVLKFPAPLQLAALLDIGEMTFTGEHALKNFGAGLERALKAITTVMDSAMPRIGSVGTKD